jgi:tetratricopeptide (TPR) repeat protein
MRSEKGRMVHKQASESLEGGEYLKALQLTDEAMTIYQTEGDEAGFAEIAAMRMLVLNMFGDRTGDRRYYILAMHTAMASLDLAEMANARAQIALAHGTLGRAMDRAERYLEAGEHFDQAIKILSTTTDEHNRKSVIADFKNHAATSRMNAGKLDQEQVALDALKELEESGDASDYEFKVWKSDGYMRLALAMKLNNKTEEAKKYLDMAEEIAKSDETLKVRREQIAMMREKLHL